MKLDELEDPESGNLSFCWSCGKQLFTIDEIAQRVCHECKHSMKQLSEDKSFFCWACGERLHDISEVAQGLCHSCKASIIRKIKTPSKKMILPNPHQDSHR
jgi:DNA-directed RNA polymerase subunit RPC12/RpoP